MLNDFSKTQPALNFPGVPALISGLQLGDILDAALVAVAPGSGMPAADVAMLNAFPHTQPALNVPGLPAAVSGVPLGDLIQYALTH